MGKTYRPHNGDLLCECLPFRKELRNINPYLVEYIMTSVQEDEVTGCYLYTPETRGKAVPFVRHNGTRQQVNRLLYSLCVGEPDEKTTRTCNNKRCVNPGHMRAQEEFRKKRTARDHEAHDGGETAKRKGAHGTDTAKDPPCDEVAASPKRRRGERAHAPTPSPPASGDSRDDDDDDGADLPRQQSIRPPEVNASDVRPST